MAGKKQKRFFTRHAKSSAALVSLAIHALIILVAVSFIAVTVSVKEERGFEAPVVKRPRVPLKKLQVPVKIQKRKPKPRLRKRLVAKRVDRKLPELKLPEVTGIKGGVAATGGTGGAGGIGFTMPEIDFFGAKAKGEKVVFIVHFGPATSGTTPYPRMTSYTIRKRLEEMVDGLPDYTLFNVTAYYKNLCTPFAEKMMPATSANKQLLCDWMDPVNPVEGSSETYGSSFNRGFNKRLDKLKWPNRLDKKIPSFGPKWYYDYRVPEAIDQKYLPGKPAFEHWSRALTWAIQTQKPDTVFILTTNYISPAPEVMVGAYRKMCRDVYGPDRKTYPTVNVVVLAHAGPKAAQKAKDTLDKKFDPVIDFFKGEGSVILDITRYMNADEKKRLDAYAQNRE